MEDEGGSQFIQQIVNEWRPTKCQRCSRFGHILNECKWKQGE